MQQPNLLFKRLIKTLTLLAYLILTEIFLYKWFNIEPYGSEKRQSGIGNCRVIIEEK